MSKKRNYSDIDIEKGAKKLYKKNYSSNIIEIRDSYLDVLRKNKILKLIFIFSFLSTIGIYSLLILHWLN